MHSTAKRLTKPLEKSYSFASLLSRKFSSITFEYDPLYWGAVFPLGMYAASTWQMDRAMEFGFLAALPRSFFYVSFATWTITFVAMLRSLLRALLSRPA